MQEGKVISVGDYLKFIRETIWNIDRHELKLCSQVTCVSVQWSYKPAPARMEPVSSLLGLRCSRRGILS